MNTGWYRYVYEELLLTVTERGKCRQNAWNITKIRETLPKCVERHQKTLNDFKMRETSTKCMKIPQDATNDDKPKLEFYPTRFEVEYRLDLCMRFRVYSVGVACRKCQEVMFSKKIKKNKWFVLVRFGSDWFGLVRFGSPSFG